MTINISFASLDTEVYRNDPSYAAVVAGPGEHIVTGTTATFGQVSTGSEYRIHEIFMEFPYTKDSTVVLDVAYFEVTIAATYGSATTRRMEIFEFDHGGTITTGDWRTPSQIDALAPLALMPGIHGASAEQRVRLGDVDLANRLQTTGAVRCVIVTDKVRDAVTPSGDQRTTIYTSEVSGTSKDPCLVWSTIKQSLLARVGGAACQLSDGTNIVIETTVAESALGATGTGLVKLRRVSSAGVATDISTLIYGVGGEFSGVAAGFQLFAVCRDSSDNIYVFSKAAGLTTSIAMKAFTKGAGLTWTAQATRTVAVGVYTNAMLNFAAAWHSVGSGGTIALIMASNAGEAERINQATPTNQISMLLLNAQAIRTGSGTIVRNTLLPHDFMANYSAGFSFYTNETCTGIDICAAPGTTNTGFLVSYNGDDGWAYNDPSITRYVINSSGNGLTDIDPPEYDLGTVTRDANSKLRAIAISSSLFAVAGGDYPFNVLQSTGFGFTELGAVSLGSLTGASGAPLTLNGITTWDLVHDTGGNKLWFYYLDRNDQRKLKRTAFDLSTMLPTNVEVTLSSSIGASGATNYAIRTPRGVVASTQLVVTIASQTSGSGAHSTIYFADSVNIAPNAPTLTPKANYDATASGTFLWTFSDPNVGDTQSAYEINVLNASSGSTIYNPGKVVSAVSQHVIPASTLSNAVAYQWRVRTWDSLDASGAFSALSPFSTGAGGNATIINPATDNVAGVISSSYAVQWSVAGTTQASYRLRVIRTSDSAVLQDTGFITSVATEHLVTGLLSGVEQRLEITVRNAALVVSGAGTRLITPQYGEPELPLVTLNPLTDEGLMEVVINNPIPGSIDLGTTPDGFELGSSSASYTTSNGALTTGSTVGQFVSASGSARLVASASGAQSYFRQLPALYIPVTPGQRYTTIFNLLSLDGASAVAASIDWYSASGGFLSTSSLSASAASGAWTSRQVTGTAPAGAASAAYGPTILVPVTVGKTIYVDDLILVAANDKPEAVSNQIYRRQVDSETTFTLVAEVDPDAIYEDHFVRSGRAYEYQVRAITSTGFADSELDTATLSLEGTGVWLLDPLDPSDSSANYRFGSGRADDLDTKGAGTFFAGREEQVFDYGEHVERSVKVSIQVPFGDDWTVQLDELEEFAELKRTVLYRDGRGRKVYGQIQGFGRTDERWGTSVSFTIEGSDYDETVA